MNESHHNAIYQPLVSIALSLYNVERYLPRCLESILGQTYTNLEVIVVDDGSPDRSGDIAEEYALRDDRVKVIRKENGGLGSARNAGIIAASGEFITFVDSDDFLAEDFVAYMVSLANKTEAEIVISKNCFTTSDASQVERQSLEIYTSERAVEEFFYPRIQLGAWNKLYRMDFIRAFDLRFVPELKTGEGLEFITRAANLVTRVGVGNRKVYVYRLNNKTSATTAANVERQGKGSLETMNYIGEHFEFKSESVKLAFHWHTWSCHRYCLRHILESGLASEHAVLKRTCVRYLRKNILFGLVANVPLKNKLLAVLTFISPILSTRIMIARRRRALSGDVWGELC